MTTNPRVEARQIPKASDTSVRPLDVVIGFLLIQ